MPENKRLLTEKESRAEEAKHVLSCAECSSEDGPSDDSAGEHIVAVYEAIAVAQDAKTAAAKDTEWRGKVAEVVTQGNRVMALLEKYGGSIVPHLMDNDENAGEALREALRQLDTEA